jgi:hypothetical protein
MAPFKQAVLSSLEFVADQHRHEIEGRHPLRLRVLQACGEDIGDPGEAELTKRTIEFGHGHVGSPVF